MSNVGLNAPTAHLGCGGMPPAAAAAAPSPGVGMNAAAFALPAGFPGIPAMPAGMTMAMPAMGMPLGMGAAMAMPAPERFASSMAGGVILGSDGAPTGRIPAGSFVDTKDGTIFGPDGKALALPAGSKADFFDLPDVKELVDMNRMATAEAARMAELAKAMGGGMTTSGPGAKTGDHHSMMQSFVDGQWGPGGVTPIKGGGAPGCDMDHGATTAAGTTPASSVAGASGGGPLGSLTSQITSLLDQIRRLTPTPTSGGGATLAASTGASALGSMDQLRASVNDLVGAIGQLNLALDAAGIRGGGPGKGPLQFPLPPAPATPAAPKVEPPKTEVPSTSSGSSDTTAPPASGSSSSS